MPKARRSIGPYELLDELGRGGAGVVYRARREDLARPVALKLILRARANPTSLGRFEREALALAKVRHPNVVRVHELGLAEQGPYLVTELVEGQSLDALSDGNPMPPRRAAEIAHGLADALAAIHEVGVVHRDLKPGNVLIRPDGSPVLLDFGLARDTESGDRLTQTGMITGTPSYMAPEQATGDSARSPDRRTDVYGLGATLYTLLTGEAPFVGSSGVQVLAAIVRSDPEWPGVATLPPGLVSICRRAMARDLKGRTPSADALRQDLERWLSGTYALKRSPFRGAAVGVSGALFVALAIGYGVSSKAPLESPAPPATPAPPAPPASPAPPQPLGRWALSRTLSPPGRTRWGPTWCRFVDNSQAVSTRSWFPDLTVWHFGEEGRSRSLALDRNVRALDVGGRYAVLPAQTRTEVLVLDLSGEGPLEVSTVTLSEELRKGGSSIQALVVNPSGTAAWLGHYDGLIQRIALPNGEVTAEATHSEKNGVAAFALREGLLVTTSSATDTEPDTEGPTIGRLDFRLRFWDAETLRPLDEFRLTAIAMAVCIAPGGESVFIGTLFGHVQHWSRSGKLLNNMVGEDIEAPHVGGRLWAKGGNLPRAHNDRITALRRGPTGLLYSIARAAGTRGQESAEFAVWNLDAGHAVNNAFRGVSGQLISDFSISPDGRRALMAYWGGKLELWER